MAEHGRARSRSAVGITAIVLREIADAEEERGEDADHPHERDRGVWRAGALNACTPFEIASVPVIAAQPSAKPRMRR